MDNESESMVSEGGSHRPHTPGHRSGMFSPDPTRPPVERGDSVMPNESASHHGDDHSEIQEPPSATVEDTPFPFKFKAPSGRVHRLQVVASAGMEALISNVTAKLGSEVQAVGGEATVEDGKLGKSGYALSYLDNEGDTVSITTDQDLLDAIALARQTNRDKVDLFVHDPEKPPLSATVDPQPVLSKPSTPPESEIRERKKAMSEDDDDDDDDEEGETVPLRQKNRERKQAFTQPKQEEQLIAGVPNDLLLPGAIAALAVVIVGVFVLSRASNK
jgi:hypothetical protein